MAENERTRDAKNDEPERRGAPLGGAPAVGDDGDVAFGGMVGAAVVSAIVISMLALGGFFNLDTTGGASSSDEVTEETTEEVVEEEPEAEPEPEEETEPEVTVEPAAASVVASDDGIVLTGTVPDQATADALVAAAAENYSDDQIDDQLEVLDGADPYTLTVSGTMTDEASFDGVQAAFGAAGGAATEFSDELALDAPPEPTGAAAVVDASQGGIVLSGTVPDEATADELRAAAAGIYTEDQIDDQLVVEDGADPYTLTVRGSMTDSVLFNSVSTAFGGLGDNAGTFTDELSLEESGDAEAALAALDQILFQSGTAVILDESLPILDEAAAIMNANPDVAFEVGGHTDSRGGDASNQALSEQRANAVVDALRSRDVENDLTARGFGETRLKENPDDTAEQQQANRRIEFRIL